MKVAVITNHPGGNAGCEKLWIAVVASLVRKGWLAGVSMQPGEEIQDSRLRQLIDSGQLELRVRNSELGRILDRLKYRVLGVTSVRQTMNWLKKFMPDVVVLNQACNIDARYWMTACREFKYRYVTISQCAAESIWPEDDHIDELLLGFQGAIKNYFVSHKNLDLTRRILGTDVANAEVCGNFYQVDYDVELPWPETTTLQFACVARLHPSSKGQDLLFDVLAEPQWRDRDFHLNLFGKGPNERSLRRLAMSLQLNEKVTFCGHLNSPEEIWKRNHVLVLPSRYEGKPLAIIEAMLCGRPVVTTDVAGNAEYIDHGVSGFVASDATTAALRIALEDAWNARQQFQEIGKTAASAIRRPEIQLVADLIASKILIAAKQSN